MSVCVWSFFFFCLVYLVNIYATKHRYERVNLLITMSNKEQKNKKVSLFETKKYCTANSMSTLSAERLIKTELVGLFNREKCGASVHELDKETKHHAERAIHLFT